MGIKCGCGKKAGQKGYGMGPNRTKKVAKKSAKKKVVKRGIFNNKRGM